MEGLKIGLVRVLICPLRLFIILLPFVCILFINLFQYENHSKSLKLEEQTLQKIKTRINEKVMNYSGTWIDWQYLLDAAHLLKKCRYSLQYTYPYAYYMEPSPRKELVRRIFLVHQNILDWNSLRVHGIVSYKNYTNYTRLFFTTGLLSMRIYSPVYT